MTDAQLSELTRALDLNREEMSALTDALSRCSNQLKENTIATERNVIATLEAARATQQLAEVLSYIDAKRSRSFWGRFK